jgi:hypothetical protein
MGAIDHLDQRRRRHGQVCGLLAAMSDEQLNATLADPSVSWRASVHGSQTGVIEIDGVKVFVKKISLTDLERAPGNERATTNLFDLPLFYQYGVGSAGFGAWRELAAALRASDWALAGEQVNFPLAYHWRVLPRTAPVLLPRQVAWLDRAVTYWDGSPAIRERLDAIAAASASIVLFLEHLPETLNDWLQRRWPQGLPDADVEAVILRIHAQLRDAAAFMNAHGMLHFDLNWSNLMTDGEQLYAADFGLTLCDDFELSAAERAFYDLHRLYDRAYIDWAFAAWLEPKGGKRAMTPALRALVDHAAPVSSLFGGFLQALAETSKLTPYPAAALQTALREPASQAGPRRPGVL